MTIVEWATVGLKLANEKGKTVDDLIVFLKNAEGVSRFFDKLFPQPVSKTDVFGKSEQLAGDSGRSSKWNLDGSCPACGKFSLSTYGISMFKDRIDTQPPFGSIGDSVDLDEWLERQHLSNTSTTPDNTTNRAYQQQYCGQRLPCGICRMTMMQCPMQVQKYEITCSSQTGTTGTVK